MPIYDLKCQKHGKVSEMLVRSAASQDISCPDYGSSNMERLISLSYLVKAGSSPSRATCCGRAERCEAPPCSTGKGCLRH